jgi:D-aminoacyl-tRNA deacylase
LLALPARVLIVRSRTDPASKNIAQQLIDNHGLFRELKGAEIYRKDTVRLTSLDKLCIYAAPAELPSDIDSIIFASKHVSSTGKPALTVHTTGNLTTSADFGGNPEEVAFVDPTIVRRVLRGLRDGASKEGLDIDVTMEATHHGPTSFPCPVCFVEIGSGPREWENSVLGKIAADAIIAAATTVPGAEPSAVGFGGTHYAAKHTRICLDGDYQIGHVVPKHAIEKGVSDQTIRATIRKTTGSCKTALVDWKGLGGLERRRLVDSLENWNYEVVRV